MYSSYRLTLADDSDIQITACDAEASKVVELLAGAMMLDPGDANLSLLVLTGQESEAFQIEAKTIVCRILAHKIHDDIASCAMQVGLAIARLAQRRGGILVHGGLAEFRGQGVILAAPGGTGKTTASMRLPGTWRSLCDDATLICRDLNGNYCCHPWPTWSRFSLNGTGGAWKTGCAVPLKALFFLSQSPNDVLEELNPSQAAAMLIESVEQANRIFDSVLSISDIHQNHHQQFSIVCELAERLPMHRLQLSLTGKFWKLIEASLEHARSMEKPTRFERDAVGEVSAKEQTDLSEVVLSGTSMYPTLKEPAFLKIHPYGQAKPRRGDVIYFRAPGSGIMVIHRVMAVGSEGLITRGDNISHNDPDVVPVSAVIGRVDTIRQGGNALRRVRGGIAGMLVYLYARLLHRTRMLAGWICRLFSPPNTLIGWFRFFVPQSACLKFVYFGTFPLGHLKIMSDTVCIGHYLRGAWHIFYPWRLLVDPAKIRAAAQQFESAKTQWRRTLLEESMQPLAMQEIEGKHNPMDRAKLSEM